MAQVGGEGKYAILPDEYNIVRRYGLEDFDPLDIRVWLLASSNYPILDFGIVEGQFGTY